MHRNAERYCGECREWTVNNACKCNGPRLNQSAEERFANEMRREQEHKGESPGLDEAGLD